MKWYKYLICFVLIIVGICSSMELVKIFSVRSAEYGTIASIETVNDYSVISVFDCSGFHMDTPDNSYFEYSITKDPEKFNGKEKDYTLLLNGQPVNNVVSTSGKISGDYIKNFYDLDGEVITTAKVHVLIEYLASGTNVTLSMENVNASVSYFETYAQVSGAVIKVVERGVK